jgi:hypothetical protein
MDENDRIEETEAYEPPAVVEVGSVSGLTGQDGSPDFPDDPIGDS